MARTLEIHPFETGDVVKFWWQWALLGLIAASAAVGVIVLLVWLTKAVVNRSKQKKSSASIPKKAWLRLQQLLHSTPMSINAAAQSLPKPKSFGVYLGTFKMPLSVYDRLFFSRYEMVIVDPFQTGVSDALADLSLTLPAHVVARLDLNQRLNLESGVKETSMLEVLNRIIIMLDQLIQNNVSRGQRKSVTGVSFAGWHNPMSAILLDALSKYLLKHGLNTYLEITPPNFLDETMRPDLSLFAGVIIKNATILSNGKVRDYFQMEKMKTTIKEFVSQSCLRQFTIMMWETVEERVEISHAVVKRSYQWCNYHGALVWIGSDVASTDTKFHQTVEEPFAAFQWLKDQKVMSIHEIYRKNRMLTSKHFPPLELFQSLEHIIPSMRYVSSIWGPSKSDNRAVSTIELQSQDAVSQVNEAALGKTGCEWTIGINKSQSDPLSLSHVGLNYTGLGCFPIGLQVTEVAYYDAVKAQSRLRRLGLLTQLSSSEVRDLAIQIHQYLATSQWSSNSNTIRALRELAETLGKASDLDQISDPIQIFFGIDSGFHGSQGAQFWSVSEFDRKSGAFIIYVSKTAKNVTSTILHTYLSTKGISRYDCFLTEWYFNQCASGNAPMQKLPDRMRQDLNILSPTDLLLFVQRFRFSTWDVNCPLLSTLNACCHELLIDVPSFEQLKMLGNVRYLENSITTEDLIDARVSWYRDHGFKRLNHSIVQEIFTDVHFAVRDILHQNLLHNLDTITTVLENLVKQENGQPRDCLDPLTDILVFSVFCATRKAAFEEIYVEVCDRNPLFNEYSDQSAAFAELFALGSRCEAYFDLTPSAFGILLSQKYREHYMEPHNQPPMWIHNAPAFASAYAAAETDVDTNQKHVEMPGYQRFTFLSVFAIPALVDITLLTTTGRGLYLSAYMQPNEQHYATIALMISLLLSGAIGTWISFGGTYYLISMAFSAANMFVLTRLLGGLSVTILLGIGGAAIITGLKGICMGVIFFFYLVALTTYLSVLAALSSYQFPGSSFLNGRTVIICVIPMLLLSPIITTFIENHDTTIYLIFIYIFIFILIMGLRSVGSKWVTWLSSITTIDDQGVKDWYIKNIAKGDKNALNGLTDFSAMSVSRQALCAAVTQQRKRKFWQTSSDDKLVQTLAESWDATFFLLNWYCRLSGVQRPMPYSSTWNIEVRVAYDSLMQNQKGIRLHSSFVHWRNAGDEVGAGILYFIVALLDRWIELVSGGPLTGLAVLPNMSKTWSSSDNRFNDDQRSLSIAIGFGLAYYLIGAVLLDYKAQHLHQLASESSPITVQTTQSIQAAEIHDAKIRRKLYVKTLLRFLGVHVWALSLCSALVWIFDGKNKIAFFTFLAYVGAYSGLLLYQYNKIFSGPHAIKPLLVAVLVGLPLGFILKRFNTVTDGFGLWYDNDFDDWFEIPKERDFSYNGVIALGVATWLAALLSFKTAKLGLPKKTSFQDETSNQDFHAYGGLGIDQKWSQFELEAFYEGITHSNHDSFGISPNDHPGTEIKSLIVSCNQENLSSVAIEAYPNISQLTEKIISSWDGGSISIELISFQSVVPREADLRAISLFRNGKLHIIVDPGQNWRIDANGITSNCKIVAETLIHAAAECLYGMNHEHAVIAESLLICRYVKEEMTRVPERLRRDLPVPLVPDKKYAFLIAARRDLLKYLCYGLPCDKNWENMPLEIRRLLLRRCLGETTQISRIHSEWLKENLTSEQGCSVETRLARFDLGAILSVHKFNYFKRQVAKSGDDQGIVNVSEDFQWLKQETNIPVQRSLRSRSLDALKVLVSTIFHFIGEWLKFAVVAPTADPEYQRELNCILQRSHGLLRTPIRYLYNVLWIYCRNFQALILPWFLFKGRQDLKKLWQSLDGTVITLKPGRLLIKAYEETTTAFIRDGLDGTFKLFYYKGIHDKEPQDGNVITICTYSKDSKLTSREQFQNGVSINEYAYEYPVRRKRFKEIKLSRTDVTRIPISRICVRGEARSASCQYNHKGFIESGSYICHGSLVRFKYHYRKNVKYDDELLRAEFVFPHLSCNVSWAAPPVRHPEKPERWIPHSRVQEATFVQGSDVYECVWVYNHQYHPVISTKLNGIAVETPEMIRNDWLGLLAKPTGTSFLEDNPLLSFPKISRGKFAQWLGPLNSKLLPASTAQKRSQLWKIWKRRPDIDGVVIRWLDERLLRQDSLLKPYWRKRDRGALKNAEDYLALHADTVMASSELSNDISAWTPLAIRLSDLFSFGQGGDAVVYTRTKTLEPDTEDTLHVIAVDTGTWPNEGGGVSACRRDLINNLRTIRWNMVVESANDFGLPKHQTQENVESLKIIPLWGIDFMHPVHGMFFNKLDSEVDHLIRDATRDDIRRNFLPTLTALVKGARAVNFSDANVKQATRAFVNLNTYFQDSRHWKEVWESDTVKDAWRHLWLSESLPNTKPPTAWFDTERPTLGHLDSALELWFRYLFIFSIPIPEKIPAVFQASHHSVSAAYGIVCKIKRNCVLQIWDHAISWRETNLYLSSALSTLPPFIRNSLLGLMRLTSMLTLHHADHILPCADFFNPGWETEIGTSQGAVEHRKVFSRKIDPIVNGITDMQKFAPVTEITSRVPTVTMLSHVWFAKDIKTALLAADVIVNQWKFTEYHLEIYGALNKAPIYSSECQEIIATKGLAPNVNLRDSADPAHVLAKTWLFLNSSVSEGLPLALGEAALTGAPVVCTDVGASLRVLTHPESNERYSEIVAPNDPLSLARAQINLLAMLGQWSKYADDAPGATIPTLPIAPTADDVKAITARMYEKSEQRRALGMMARSIVQRSFSGERYLREHEQMLWVGKSRYDAYGLGSNVSKTDHELRGKISTTVPQIARIRGDRPHIFESKVPQRTGNGQVTLFTREPLQNSVDTQLEKMVHPAQNRSSGWMMLPIPRPLSAAGATSFTSVYTDNFSDISQPAPSSVGHDGSGVHGYVKTTSSKTAVNDVVTVGDGGW